MDLSHALRVASRLGVPTHRAAARLAFQKQTMKQGKWRRRVPLFLQLLGIGFVICCSHAAAALNPCDLNGDGVVNLADAQLAVSMSLGQVPCTASIDGNAVCNVVIVQRVVNASTSGTCVTGNSHVVSLNWTASTSPSVAGYNVFRGVASGGPYTQLNSSLVPVLSYSDNNVLSGQGYYYVTTAVDVSADQSVYSNEAPATIPSP